MRCRRAPLPHRLAVPVRWSGVVRDTASGPVSRTVSAPLRTFLLCKCLEIPYAKFGMKIALYARVSTADQNCQMQLRELREYAAARKWTIYAEYVDTGWSGAKASRPELNRLMADVRKRRFDAVCVWKLDRWGRSVADSIKSIQELTSLGVRFVAVTQNLDTEESNPMARFFLHIMMAFSELEREITRERVVAGVKAARANGKQLGRPRRVFRRDEAVRLREAGMSWRKIAAELGVPVTTVVEGCR
jgi:putative DNA-invertase from lambdoid prophage Rac